ncbi:hypothetical protein Dsin_015123 [Dipteronia sinensis]|uniref:Uncharacterized protein n=1 Tax=Dipteronia sinensis TaxID=43782 RepID=A0AAE0EAF5_9ROSI|nr:hypothetical protein Dsin_015123 [Dipteronia sinensis]
MAATNIIWSVSIKMLDDAAKSRTGKQIITGNGKPSDLAVQTSPESSLITAYDLVRFNLILVIGSIIPELACEKIQGGYTLLHLACILGDVDMVRALVGLGFDRLHYEKDHYFSMTPLHMAVVHGRLDVISVLLSACPDSIKQLTSELRTVFHLAVECFLPDVFAVLWEEAKKLDKDYLLYRVDCKGNSLLHCAVFNNQLRIVEMCLTDQRWITGHGFAMWVNTTNIEGDTAMDLYNKIPDPDSETHRIGCILYVASQRERHSLSSPSPSSRALETNTEHLAVLAIFIGLAFAVICALPSFFPKDGWVAIPLVFEFKDALYGELPLIFYLMFFITILFTTSAGFLIVLLYSLPCRTVMLLGGISTFFLYLLLTHYIMPKFFVRAGSLLVPSYYFMWVLILVFIFTGALIIHLGNYLMLLSYNHAKLLLFQRPPSNQSYDDQEMVLLTTFAVVESFLGRRGGTKFEEKIENWLNE